ncbi:MAG: Type 1 glutamine amidotransferase-like domain-containing protein [Patescibacteria group bacterium]
MKSIIIRGPLGVGKSTVAKAVAEKIGGIYISVDEVLDQNGLDKAVEGEGIPLANFLKANEIIALEAKQAKDRGQSVVIDGNFYHKEQIDQLIHLLERDTLAFTLKASVETCIARDAARTKPYGKDATRAVHMFVSAFDYGTVIDTEVQAPEETTLSVMRNVVKPNTILTSSFNTVVGELQEKSLLPKMASVAFIPTAGDPYPERPWIDADRKALAELGYSVTDIDLKSRTADSLEKELSSHDIVFVAGGNTTYLVEQVHLSGFSPVVKKLLGKGKMYIGSSAGSILAGPTVEPFAKEDIAELSKDFVLINPSCLRLVDYVVLPHDQVEQFSAEHNKIVKQYGERFTFVRLTDKEYRTENICPL